MAYTAPSVTEFRTRFPEFTVAIVSDAQYAAVLAEAQRFVDTSWYELDYKTALMYRVAHILAAGGALRPTSLTSAGASSGVITSERLGDASVTYATGSSESAGGDIELASTPYGQRFLELQRANHPGVIII